MPTPAVGQALRAWLIATTGLPDSRVIFANRNAPRPPAPYAVVNPDVSTIRVGSYDEARGTDDPDVLERVGQRRILVSVNLFGSDAKARLEAALEGLESEAQQGALAAAGLSFIEHAQAQDRTEMLATRYRGRAQADVSFYVVASRLEEVGHVATVEGTGTVDGVSFDYTTSE